MIDEPRTDEQPSGHLRLLMVGDGVDVLQQLWYITEYRGTDVSQREEWRDVPAVTEP